LIDMSDHTKLTVVRVTPAGLIVGYVMSAVFIGVGVMVWFDPDSVQSGRRYRDGVAILRERFGEAAPALLLIGIGVAIALLVTMAARDAKRAADATAPVPPKRRNKKQTR
jgi:hypothetical protein